MTRRDASPVRLTVRICGRTPAAMRVHQGDASRAVWLPASQILSWVLAGVSAGDDELCDMTLPRWLANEKGLRPQPQRGPGLFDAEVAP